MPTVTLTRATKRTVSLIVRDGETTTHRLTVSPDNPSSRKTAAAAVGCDDATLLGWLDRLERSPEEPRRYSAEVGVTQTLPKVVELLDRIQGNVIRTGSTSDLESLLRGSSTEQLLRWGDRDAACCLDIDYHDKKPPRREVLESWMSRMAPTPLMWHLSRGGGVHAFYVAKPPYTAVMLAAAAALRFSAIDPSAGLELKSQVRGLGDAELHLAPAGQDTAGVLSSWIGRDVAEEEDVRDWLAEAGMEIGSRYGHDRCPIAPGAATSAVGDPVAVGEKGVYCHRCAGHGLSLGSRSPGFAPFAALCGSPSSGEVGRLVRHLAHWGHARYVLTQRYGLPEALARPAYEAALLATHPDKAAIVPYAFDIDTADMARVNDSWYSVNSAYCYNLSGIDPLVGKIPGAMAIDAEGKPKPKASTVAYLKQGVDLTARGYQNLQIVHGFQFAKQFLPPPDATFVSVTPAGLRGRCEPRYVKRSVRKPSEWAWGVLETVFPRINRELIRALLCASGCSQETKLGLHPLIFVAGTSASSKTMTTLVASGIIGSGTAAVTYSNDEGRMRQAIMGASLTGAIVRADEFLKESKRALRQSWSPKVALEPLLTLTPSTLGHVLYVGPRKLGRVPVFVITETVCPPSIKQYTQIARRVRFVQLHGNKRDWEGLLSKAGLTGETMPLLRTVSSEMNEACDTIISDVVDDFFAVPMTWGDMADALGLPTIEASEDFDNPVPSLLRFYQLVCLKPPQTDKHATRYKAADGWRRVSKNEISTPDDQELVDLLDGFSDEQGKGWGESLVLREKDWGGLLGVPMPVILDIHPEAGSVAYVRFRVGQPHRLLAVNGGIKNPAEVNSE